MKKRYTPNKAQKERFIEEIKRVEQFLDEHPEIGHSILLDSYYFNINGKNVRVSNHTIDASDRGMYDRNGDKVRDSYHSNCNYDICITASKLRLPEIYNDLMNGYELTKRGVRKMNKNELGKVA